MKYQVNKLIESITENKIEKVKEFLGRDQWNQIYDGQNVSILMISLITIADIEKEIRNALQNDTSTDDLVPLVARQIEIHEILVSRGQVFGPHEVASEILEKLQITTKIKLRTIHKRINVDSLKHLTSLITKSKLSHDTLDSDRRKFLQCITASFEELNQIKIVEPILKVAAENENLKIIFDFYHETVEQVDPVQARNDIHGAVYLDEGDVYIGAKKLLSENDRYEVLGHLTHEITHFALHMIYKNNAKPYSPLSDYKEEFEMIVKACESKKTKEKFIYLVFTSYKQSNRHSELIVRAPHLVVLYKDNKEKLQEVQSTFADLFNFFNTRTLVDIKREQPLLEARRNFKELNDLFGVAATLKTSDISCKKESFNFSLEANKVLFVSSNCVKMTMRLIFQKINFGEKLSSSTIFVKLESIRNKKKFSLIVKTFESIYKPLVIVDCDMETAKSINIMTKKLLNEGLNENFVVVHDSTKFQGLIFNHSWNELTEDSQKKLLKLPLLFQGKKIILEDLLPLDSSALDHLPLKTFFEGHLKVGDKIFHKDLEFYVERTFSDESTFRPGKPLIGINAENLLKEAEEQKVLLLSNEPTMGKSIEFKMIARRIKINKSSVWVTLINMKDFVGFYENDDEISKTFQDREEIIEFFCEKILNIRNFEAKVFAHLFNVNRVVFLFDGFDEISPTYKQFNLNLLQSIREHTENELWISTRPHLKHELKFLLNCASFTLDALRYGKRKDFIIKLYESRGFKGEELNEKFRKTHDHLELLFHRFLGEIDNPILIQTVIKLIEEEGDLNNYSIFRSFVLRMIDHFLKKGTEAERDVIEIFTNSIDVMAFHQKRAIFVHFKNADEATKKAVEVCFEGTAELSFESMARVGFLVAIRPGELTFNHHAFAEFFAAEYFTRNLFKVKIKPENNRTKAIVSLFRSFWLYTRNFKGAKLFMDNAFELMRKHDQVRYQRVKLMFKNYFSSADLRLVFYSTLIDLNGLINVVKCLPIEDHSIDKSNLKQIILGSVTTPIEAMVIEEEFESPSSSSSSNKSTLSAMSSKKASTSDNLKNTYLKVVTDENALMAAIGDRPLNFIEEIVSLAERALGTKIIEEMCLEQHKNGHTVLTLCLRNQNDDVFKFFWDHPALSDEVKRKNILNHCGYQLSKNLLIESFSTREKERDLILDFSESSLSSNEFKCLLTSTDREGDTILQSLLDKFDPMTFKRIKRLIEEKLTTSELNELILKSNYWNDSLLELAISIEDDDDFFMVWNFLRNGIVSDEDFKQQLLYDNKGTIFYSAAIQESFTKFEFIKKVYKEALSIEEMKTILNRPKLLRICLSNSIKFESFKNLEVLWSYMQELLTINEIKIILNEKQSVRVTILEILKEEYENKNIKQIFGSFISTYFNI